MEETVAKRQMQQHAEVWRRRLRMRRGLSRATSVAAAGTTFVAVLAGFLCLVAIPAGWPVGATTLTATILSVVVAASAVAYATARASVREAAIVADLVTEGHALMATALDIASRATLADQSHREVLDAAVARAGELAPGAVVSVPRRRPLMVFALTAVLGTALPSIPFALDQEGIDNRRRLMAAADELEQVTREDEKKKDEEVQDTKGLRSDLRRLRAKMKAAELEPRDAAEQLGDIKRRLRAKKLERDAAASRSGRGARAAARMLGRNENTQDLSKQVAANSRGELNADERERGAQAAGEALRKLAKLDTQGKSSAREALEKAAGAAEDAGNWRLAEAMRRTADALAECGDGECDLGEAARGLESAMMGDNASLDELAEALERAQQRLSGIDKGDGSFEGGRPGQAGQIAPEGPRQWSTTPGENNAAGAGTEASDDEAPPTKTEEEHQDADRATARKPDEWEVEFRELYESELDDDSARIMTTVRGDKSNANAGARFKGGLQVAGPERAKRVMRHLPASYQKGARRAITDEAVPAGYRDAVKDYFSDR